jgi:hypothetical protein
VVPEIGNVGRTSIGYHGGDEMCARDSSGSGGSERQRERIGNLLTCRRERLRTGGQDTGRCAWPIRPKQPIVKQKQV